MDYYVQYKYDLINGGVPVGETLDEDGYVTCKSGERSTICGFDHRMELFSHKDEEFPLAPALSRELDTAKFREQVRRRLTVKKDPNSKNTTQRKWKIS